MRKLKNKNNEKLKMSNGYAKMSFRKKTVKPNK